MNTNELSGLLREAADALWLIPTHAGLAHRLSNAAAEMTRLVMASLSAETRARAEAEVDTAERAK